MLSGAILIAEDYEHLLIAADELVVDDFCLVGDRIFLSLCGQNRNIDLP